MRRRIEQLLNGIYEYKSDPIQIEPAEVSVLAVPGAVIHGTLHLKTESELKMKGFVYPSSPRIVCMPQQFQGVEQDIFYQIDCSGLEEGSLENAQITVCTDRGEYTIPFTIQTSEHAAVDHKPPFQTVEEFSKLAETEFQRAYRYFIHPEFSHFLQVQAPDLLECYNGFTAAETGYQSLEYFLQEAGLKERPAITLSASSVEKKGMKNPEQEVIVLTKNTWGFDTIQVKSDARFLRPEKKLITTDEFAGSTYELNIVMDTNLMHAGKNYGRVSVTMCGETQTIDFMVKKEGLCKGDRQNHIRKIMMKKMEALYVQFRLKKIDLSDWVENSISVINSYKRAEGKDPFADLFLVQLYFADGKQQKALKILEQFDTQKRRLDTPERYGFYLYMTTFFYHEAAYVDRVEEEIEKMFCKDKTSWILQWILFYLQEAYLKDDDARYEAVERQYDSGCRSRIMYLEAYQILKKTPFRMRHISAYELSILKFAMKEEVLTAEMMRQISALSMHMETFDARLFEILTIGYNLYPSKDLIQAICHILIQGGKKDRCYFEWYKKGIDTELRMTGLYEHYMETMDSLDMQQMPQIIRMYFAYDNTLDQDRRTAIYRRIIEQYETDPQTYHHYRAAMEKFTLDQLLAERITDDLTVLYKKFLRKSSLSNLLAEKLAKLLFTYEITTDQKLFTKAILRSSRLAKEVVCEIEHNKGLIQCFDPESVLLLEDENGLRYPGEGHAAMRRFFSDDRMIEWCRELAPETPALILDLCRSCLNEIDHNTIRTFVQACELETLSPKYRTQIRRQVLRYYTQHLHDDSLPEFLDKISFRDYISEDKASLITLLAEDGRCVEAFELLDEFGAEGIPLVGLVRICSRMVLEMEFEENTMLVSLCHYCFSSGKYDDKLLRYLLLYYEGPVNEMTHVWKAAQSFELDTISLEEKILMMILFTRTGTEGSEPVFESYLNKMGRKKLCRAYANLKSYEYFVKEIPAADCLFRFLETEYERSKKNDSKLQTAGRLALLKYYSGLPVLKENQRQNAGELLADCVAKGYRFSFWQRFDKDLIAAFEMEGKVFAEYVGNPDSEVMIFYRLAGKETEFAQEIVKNCFEGIFVREYTLFSDEKLEYYITESYKGETKKSDICLLGAPKGMTEEDSRYQLLGKIIHLAEQGKTEEAQEEVESYQLMGYLAQELFTIV